MLQGQKHVAPSQNRTHCSLLIQLANHYTSWGVQNVVLYPEKFKEYSYQNFYPKSNITHFRLTVNILFQVKAATGEEVSAENLGGADLHCG